MIDLSAEVDAAGQAEPPVLTFMNGVVASIESVAPSEHGERAISEHRRGLARCSARYVWILRGADPAGTVMPGGNPKSIGDDAWEIEVHCQADNVAQALRLRQALLTAVRTMRGVQVQARRTDVVTDAQELQGASVAAVQLVLTAPLYEAVLPCETPGVVKDRVYPTGRATRVVIDPNLPAPPVRGDGKLTGLEG